jgi:dienelactone hydrolase
MRAAHDPWKLIIATVLAVPLSGRSAPALADERVNFDTAVPRSEQDAAGVGRAAIKGYLTKPSGQGPFPAVVLLHSCLGLPVDRNAIGKMIASWGYVALFVDDFGTRGLMQTCAVDFPEGIADAYGALNYVARVPFVDRTRIAAVGYSQGADTALTIGSGRFASAFVLPQGAKFKAAAAFYPPCANQRGRRLVLPTLIVVGDHDDVTPAADCARLADAQPENRHRSFPEGGSVLGIPGQRIGHIDATVDVPHVERIKSKCAHRGGRRKCASAEAHRGERAVEDVDAAGPRIVGCVQFGP